LDRKKLFDRAYRKASQMRAGDPDPLTPLESQELLASIERYKARKEQVFYEVFMPMIVEKELKISEVEAKFWFKSFWEEHYA